MADSAGQGRTHAVQEFAQQLATLRESAGTPSFRELAGRSHAISHTTLHAAAQGFRLPSWPTTVEFVRACGGEPEDYRARWEAADRAVSAPMDGADEPAVVPDEPAVAPEEPAVTPSSHRFRGAPVRVAAVAVAVALVAVVAVVVVVTQVGDRRSVEATERAESQCPLRPTNPTALGEPAHVGDDAAFLADITLPDCTRVPPSTRLTKIWRLKNVGSVAWTGYSLRREGDQERDNCQTITDVPVPYTAPGGIVDVEVRVLTPDSARLCVAKFMLVDATGLTAFPGRRTVNFQLVVDPELTETAAPATSSAATSTPATSTPATSTPAASSSPVTSAPATTGSVG